MTTLAPQPFDCPACGAGGTRTVVTSTNELEAPDLDLRPGEMLRSTMPYWVVVCERCGYVFDPDKDPGPVRDPALVSSVLQTTAYRDQLIDPALPALADRFLCCALLAEARGD